MPQFQPELLLSVSFTNFEYSMHPTGPILAFQLNIPKIFSEALASPAYMVLSYAYVAPYTISEYCIVGTIKGGGRGPRRNQPYSCSLPLGIIHGHLIVLVRYKQAQMRLQSDPKCYERFSTKF